LLYQIRKLIYEIILLDPSAVNFRPDLCSCWIARSSGLAAGFDNPAGAESTGNAQEVDLCGVRWSFQIYYILPVMYYVI